jgi:diguanylate cyclase (GGDEF)-like protein/PAS domain S-box-containing protein
VTAPPPRLVAAGRVVPPSLEGPAFLVAGLVLNAFGMAGPLFWWSVPFMVLAALLDRSAVQRWLAGGELPRRAGLRLAIMLGTVATVLYLVGWGPLLSFAFIGVTAHHMRVSGARIWRQGLVGTLIVIGAGQAAVAARWVPSYLPEDLAQASGLTGAFVSVVLIRIIGLLGEQREAAEAAVRASEERFRALVQDSCDVIALVDIEGTVVYVSPGVHHLLGVEQADLISGRFDGWLLPADLPVGIQVFEAALTDPGGQHRCEIRMRHTDGRYRWVEATLRNLTDNPAVNGLVANLRDITERRAVVDRLNFDANHDALTGLLNRAAFLRELHRVFAAGPAAVLFLDLDGLKGVNDTFGHGAGDATIIAAAGMLQRSVLGSDVTGRLGGDEFAIILPGSGTIDHAVTVAERLLVEFDRPVSYDDHTLRVRVSVGIAVTDDHCPDATTLLNRADAAMYRAKRRGTHSYEVHIGWNLNVV